MMGKPIHLIAGLCYVFLFLFLNTANINGYGLAQCPSSFLLQANINKTNIKVDMKIKKRIVKCAFLEYMWHVMVHRKHSRLAKAPSDESHSKRQRGHSPGKPLDVFFPVVYWWRIVSKGFTESRARSDSWTAMQRGRGFIRPFASLHSQVSVGFFFFLFSATVSLSRYSLSILNVSSVAESASTMSGSLSMCSPSRVSGSIFSSSRGN